MLQSSFSRCTVGLHLLSHLDITVPIGSLRRIFGISWYGNRYADARPRLHPFPCLQIGSNAASLYKQGTQIRKRTSCTLHHQNTRDGAVHGVSAAFKLGREERKKHQKASSSFCQQMAIVLRLFTSIPFLEKDTSMPSREHSGEANSF